MIKKNKDSILVFEYFTASGEKDKSIICEAEALIFSLIDDLSDFSIDLVINKDYEDILASYNNVNPIYIDENVIDWLKNNASNFNRAIFIAGENNNNLYNITKILEENNVKTYTSSSFACLKASDKYKTYTELLTIVPQPKSFEFTVDSNGRWLSEIKKLNFHKLIIKPLIGVDCEDIVVIDDFSRDMTKIFPHNSKVLVQEFIDGEDISVSLISDGVSAVPISLNKQFIEFNSDKETYGGGKLPYNVKLKDKAFKTAVNAVESINGLKGFVGVDLIVNDDEVYLLEINSRFTTPYVGLKQIINFNIGKTIIDLIDGEININALNISFDGEVEFKKEGDALKIRRL